MLVMRLTLPPPVPGVRGLIPRIRNLKACLVQKEIPRLALPVGVCWLIAAVKQLQADLEDKFLKTKESVMYNKSERH